MERIASFSVDHTVLEPGIYVSRIDGDITTYDLRMRKPNTDDLMTHSAMHSLEHTLATFLRNSSLKDDVIYCGPMGCQTGFYVLIRNSDNNVFLEVLKKALLDVINYNGEMPGNSPVECGNYKTLSMNAAKEEAKRYLEVLYKPQTFLYK